MEELKYDHLVQNIRYYYVRITIGLIHGHQKLLSIAYSENLAIQIIPPPNLLKKLMNCRPVSNLLQGISLYVV